MNIDEMKVGDLKALMKVLSGNAGASGNIPDPEGAKRIVILQRGWIVVGDVSLRGDELLIENSSVIRNWGTTKGLGEIAKNGPTDKTVLDPSGTVRCHAMAVVAQIECNGAKWK